MISTISVLVSAVLLIGMGILMDLYGFIGISILCAIAWGSCSIIMTYLDKPAHDLTNQDIRGHYYNIFSKQYRPYLILAMGYQFVIIAAVVITPLILYLATNTFTGMSIIAAAAMIVQLGIIMIYGVWVDKSQSNQNPLILSLVTHGLGLCLFALFSKITMILFLAQTFQRTGFIAIYGTTAIPYILIACTVGSFISYKGLKRMK